MYICVYRLDKSNYLLSRAFSSSNGRVMITMHIPFKEGSIKNRFYGCSEMVLRKLFNRISRYKNEYRLYCYASRTGLRA